jgi:hypothetical protein
MLPQFDGRNGATGMVLIFERCVPTRRVRTTEFPKARQTLRPSTRLSRTTQLIESSDDEDDDNDVVSNAI